LTTDASGKLYVCGATSSIDLPLANPGGGAYYQSTPGGNGDAFIARFSAGGALEWSTYFGGDYSDEASGVAVASTGLYLVGDTQSTNFPTFNPGGGAFYQGTLQGNTDALIARFSNAGAQTWTTYYGGSTGA